MELGVFTSAFSHLFFHQAGRTHMADDDVAGSVEEEHQRVRWTAAGSNTPLYREHSLLGGGDHVLETSKSSWWKEELRGLKR